MRIIKTNINKDLHLNKEIRTMGRMRVNLSQDKMQETFQAEIMLTLTHKLNQWAIAEKIWKLSLKLMLVALTKHRKLILQQEFKLLFSPSPLLMLVRWSMRQMRTTSQRDFLFNLEQELLFPTMNQLSVAWREMVLLGPMQQIPTRASWEITMKIECQSY